MSGLARSLRLIVHVAGFEIGRQARQPVVWIAGAIFFAFAVMLISADGFMGTPVLSRNAPAELARTTIVLSIFYVFVAVALAGDAALRDAASGFESILKAAPISRFERLLGRFLGLQVVSVLTFVGALGGLLLGAVAPWTDKATIGVFHWPQIAAIVAVIAVPNVIAVTAGCFAIAAALRSTTAVYVAVIAALLGVLVLPGMMAAVGGPALRIVALFEPFGLAAFVRDTLFVDPSRRGVEAFPLDGLLIANRVVGLFLTAAVVGIAFVIERRVDEARLRRRPETVEPAPAAARIPRFARQFGLPTRLSQFLRRLRFEVVTLLRSPSLLILAALILLGAATQLWTANSLAGTPSLPATRVMAETLATWMMVLGLIVSSFYAGEIVWRERDRRVSDLIDASPIPDALLLAPKLLAVMLVLTVLMAAGVAAAVGVQLLKGYMDATPAQYLSLVIVPIGLQLLFFVAFSMAAAALAPHRLVAWGATAALLAFSITSQAIGFSHPLFDPASMPVPTFSEMNPDGDGTDAMRWTVLYWCLWAGLLLVLAWLFWPRGHRAPVRASLANAARRLRGPGGKVAAALAVATVAAGTYVFLNTNVWSEFYTKAEADAFLARYERTLTPFEAAPQPSIVAIAMRVDIEPRHARLVAHGAYTLRNVTDRPISGMHVQLPAAVDDWSLNVQGARLTREYEDFGFCVFTFDKPLLPGEQRILTFRNSFRPRGFGDAQTSIVRNGTFVENADFAPTIGVTDRAFLTDADDRRRQGLAPERPMRDPLGAGARDRNYIRADLATLDITVSTERDQTPIAPGKRVSDVVEGDRRVARFVSDKPIKTFFSVQSARYEVRTVRHKGIEVAVYFHPGHGQNVERMIRALTGGLDVYQTEFGPYPFDYLRIVEFPAHGNFAQAFAGTIPFSENVGFITDVRNPKHFDYVTSITLHELAHQWWAHQVVGADAKGALLLSEGLSDYSAVMAQARLQGFGMANKSLAQMRKEYDLGQAERREAQPSLARVQRESYVAYQQAAMVLTQVRSEIGEPALHRALRRLLTDYGSKGAPYPISDDLLAEIRAESTPAQWKVIEPLFTEPGLSGMAFFANPTAPLVRSAGEKR